MKIVYFENSVNFLTNEDRELFRSIVGNDIDTIESAIKQESENLIQRIYSNEKYINNIAIAGYNRFMKDHESTVRLSKLLKEIKQF